jgi:subtilisin-like proprotein convertase family protein
MNGSFRPVVIGGVAALLGSSTVSADELTSTREQPLFEVSHAVDIRIADGVATYRVRRQFANPGKVADEAGLAIELPAGAAATGLRIRAKDRWYDGVLMERDRAAQLYHELTGLGAYQPKDPALLQWQWADKLYLQVFPVMPGQVSTVEYTLTVPTRYAGGRYWVSYPRTDIAAAAGRPLATPTISVKPAYGDALTAISIDGRRVAPETPIVLVVPPRAPWQDIVEASEEASYASSVLEVPASSHTKQPITTAKLELGITHTYQGDLRIELVTPQGKRVKIHDQAGGTKNNIGGAHTVALPAGTIGAGLWRLVVSDHAAADAGTIDRWKLSFGSGASATTTESTDVPVFVPDAPENGDAGVATISIAPPRVATWSARFGRVVASPANSFGRLELDVAPQLSKLPVRAQVVFVVDASYSAGREVVAAQLATIKAYLSHLPDADVEIIAYRRRAQRVIGGFVPTKDALATLARITPDHPAFTLGNGSALDEGAKLAASVLANRNGPRRVVVLTDELLRSRLTPERALAAFDALSKETIVHVVVPHADHDDRVTLVRDDAHKLARLATRHHGILAHLHGLPATADKDLPPLVLELVRPTRIEKLTASGFTLESSTLREGDGLRLWSKGKTVPAHVTLAGYLWSDPIRKQVDAGREFSRATAAFVFGADEHTELTPAEMMTVALFGRAVSPVTSYVAFEPGTRPSTIGLEDTATFGGLLGHGMGAGGGGFGFGAHRSKPTIDVDPDACVKQHRPASGWRVSLDVETTKDEIVDVELAHGSGAFASCLVDATWAVRLDRRFDQERETFTVTLSE